MDPIGAKIHEMWPDFGLRKSATYSSPCFEHRDFDAILQKHICTTETGYASADDADMGLYALRDDPAKHGRVICSARHSISINPVHFVSLASKVSGHDSNGWHMAMLAQGVHNDMKTTGAW